MARRPRTRTRREGWYCLSMALLIFAGAIWRDVNLLLMLSGVVIGPMIFGVHAVRVTLKGLKARRRIPKQIMAGQTLALPIELINPRRRLSLWGVWARQSILRVTNGNGRSRWKPFSRTASSSSNGDFSTIEVLFPYVPPGQSRVASCSARIMRRGRYKIGPLRLATSFPFGLFERTSEPASPEGAVGNGISEEEVLVYPAIGRLTRHWAERRRDALLGQCHRELRGGVEGDFLGLRAWRQGDGRRRIDWRASARLIQNSRQGQTGLVVRQFEKPRSRDIAIILDLFSGEAHEQDNQMVYTSAVLETAVEKAVAFAATLVDAACREGGGNLLQAVWDSGPSLSFGPVSPGLFEEAMTALALVSSSEGDHLNQLMTETVAHLGRDMEVVVLTIGQAGTIDSRRLPILSSPGRGSLRKSMRVIDVNTPDFEDYVRFDGLTG